MSNTLTDKETTKRESFAIREGHDNFFTPLRLIFASLVVFGHSFAVALRDASAEPHILYHYTFSYLAVNLFFIASGFLVTKSMVYRGDAPSFISARALRIFPALIIHVFFVMIVIGPLATKTPLAEFFRQPDWYLQPFKVLTFIDTKMIMPGMFQTNAEDLGSAALWTLRYEVLAYIGTLLVFSLGMLRKKWMVLAQFVLPSLAWMLGDYYGLFTHFPSTIENLMRFGIAYGLGATIYAYRDRLNFSWIALAVMVFASYVFHETRAIEVIVTAILAWIVFRFAYMKMPSLDWTKRLPDLSYGIYIYHWCILQLLFYWMPNLGVLSLFILTFLVTIGLAALSWYLVEKPALRSKTQFAEALRKFGLKRSKVQHREYLLD